MGAKDLWGHDAFFDCVGRWSEKEAPKGKDFYSFGPAPIKGLWLKYRRRADEMGKACKAKRQKPRPRP